MDAGQGGTLKAFWALGEPLGSEIDGSPSRNVIIPVHQGPSGVCGDELGVLYHFPCSLKE